MNEELKSDESRLNLARLIRAQRKALGLTIEVAEKRTGVDRGQISRFETGKFKTASKNLQKICIFLQIDINAPHTKSGLGERLDKFAARSMKHKVAAEEMLKLLETFESQFFIH